MKCLSLWKILVLLFNKQSVYQITLSINSKHLISNNVGPLLAHSALTTSQSCSTDTLPRQMSKMKIRGTKKTRDFMKRTMIVLNSTSSDIYVSFYFTSYLSCQHVFAYSKYLTKMFLILLPPALLLLISYPVSVSG